MKNVSGDGEQRPEGKLIAAAMFRKRLKRPAAAQLVGVSDGWLGNVVKGYRSDGKGKTKPVVADAAMLARIAHALGISGDELRDVGREDAVEPLLLLTGMYAEAALREESSALRKLIAIRNDVDALIDELRSAARQ